eukprot:gene8395-10350_t
MTFIAKTALIALSLIATAASAQAVRTEKNMSLELANQIATATVAACSANGYAVTATVVDRAGSVRAVQRAAGPFARAAQQVAHAQHKLRRVSLCVIITALRECVGTAGVVVSSVGGGLVLVAVVVGGQGGASGGEEGRQQPRHEPLRAAAPRSTSAGPPALELHGEPAAAA